MTTDRKASRENENGFKRQVFDKAAVVAAAAMRGASGWQKFVVFACYLIGSITLVVLFVPPYEALKQLIAGGAAVLCIFVAMMFVIWHYQHLSGKGVAPDHRAVPDDDFNVVLSVSDLEKIRNVLEDTRKAAYDFLRDKNADLLDKNVRANIFFPEGKQGDYCLRIRSGLHLKMNHEPELKIVLKPDQGVTSQAFKSGQPQVARRIRAGSGDSAGGWDSTHHITKDLEKIIHRDLEWIISMPLKRGGGGKCIGVMNVDGLVCEFDTDVLFDCATKKLTSFALLIAGLIP